MNRNGMSNRQKRLVEIIDYGRIGLSILMPRMDDSPVVSGLINIWMLQLGI